MADELELSALRKSLASLQEALQTVGDQEWLERQSTPAQNLLVAGVIQNFERVYEAGVKMLKRRIELDAASPAEVDTYSFRDLLRIAAEKGWIDEMEVWLGYRQMRNITAHVYDQDKARLVYEKTQEFFAAAASLLARLEARNG
jgi:nucleotidyltransferase substrate binding protein (TIGR01987 family)